MKIGIISDIHGVVPAFIAVLEDLAQWDPDLVVVNGDTVNRGPQSHLAWQMVRERAQRDGWIVLRGNHERYLCSLDWEQPGISDTMREITAQSRWNYQQHRRQVDELAALPSGWSWWDRKRGQLLRVRHASMWADHVGLYADATDGDLLVRSVPAPSIFIVGHTHRPFRRQIGDLLVVNGGAVGVPLDGDVRASYTRLWSQNGVWRAAVPRIPYDREAAKRQFQQSGFLHDSGYLSWILYYEWEQAQSLLPTWFRQYRAAAEAGEIDVETAVRLYLKQLNLPVPI